MATIKPMNVPTRYFTYNVCIDDSLDCVDLEVIEVSESVFLEVLAEYPESIEYRRNTVYLNGVSQIILTVGEY